MSRQPSTTALGVAALRAVHQLHDGGERVLDDPVIVKLLGGEFAARLDAERERYDSDGARALRAHVVLRSRYAEDRLAAAVARGVRQYVILGAGLDTFAYRQPAWTSALRIFEVDQPASQETKREMLERAGIAIPPNVGFGAVNFEHETLADGLARAGLDRGAPAFFSWLGVTMYLTREAIEAVLRTVAEFPARSELVLTFAHPPAPGEPTEHPLAIRAATVGEPWVRPACSVHRLASSSHSDGRLDRTLSYCAPIE